MVLLLVWHFSINFKKKDLTMRIDPLLKFSSNKSVGKLNLGRETEREAAAAVYSKLPTLARMQWKGSAENWRVPLPAGGGFGHRPASRGAVWSQVRALAVVSPAGTEPTWQQKERT